MHPHVLTARLPVSAVMTLAVLLMSWGQSDASLVAHWNFDEGEGFTAHDQLGMAHGVLVGCARWHTGDGVCGTDRAIYLDGPAEGSDELNGFVDIGDPAHLRFPNGPFSIVLWLKTCPDFYTAVAISRHIGGTINGYFVFTNETSCYGDPNQSIFYVSDHCGQEAASLTNVNDGAWHQVAGTYNPGGTHIIYIDGQAEGQGPSQSMIVHGAARLLIGGITIPGTGAVGGFRGLLDDVRIYDHVLDPAEILENWNSCRPPGENIPLECDPCTATHVDPIDGSYASSAILALPRPNPATTTATIGLELGREGDVILSVHDASGRLVRILADGRLGSGIHSFDWNARDESGTESAAGLYFYQLCIDGRPAGTKKVLILE